jgi:hypothetical protein
MALEVHPIEKQRHWIIAGKYDKLKAMYTTAVGWYCACYTWHLWDWISQQYPILS